MCGQKENQCAFLKQPQLVFHNTGHSLVWEKSVKRRWSHKKCNWMHVKKLCNTIKEYWFELFYNFLTSFQWNGIQIRVTSIVG